MDIGELIGNRELLVERVEKNNPALELRLKKIYDDAVEELKGNGKLLRSGGKSVAEIASEAGPEQQKELVVSVGDRLINMELGPMTSSISVVYADYFPNCIFIAVCCRLESMEGAVQLLLKDRKWSVVCSYETDMNGGNPLGRLIHLLIICYPWITLSPRARHTLVKPPELQQDAAVHAASRPAETSGEACAGGKKEGFWSRLFGL